MSQLRLMVEAAAASRPADFDTAFQREISERLIKRIDDRRVELIKEAVSFDSPHDEVYKIRERWHEGRHVSAGARSGAMFGSRVGAAVGIAAGAAVGGAIGAGTVAAVKGVAALGKFVKNKYHRKDIAQPENVNPEWEDDGVDDYEFNDIAHHFKAPIRGKRGKKS